MKIVENSDDRLTILVVPWIESGVCLVFGINLVGATIFADMAEDLWVRALVIAAGLGLIGYAWRLGWLRVHFDRAAGQVSWSINRPFWSKHNHLPLKTVTGVMVDDSYADYEGTNQLVFETPDGRVPILAGFKLSERDKFQKSVNAWLSGKTT